MHTPEALQVPAAVSIPSSHEPGHAAPGAGAHCPLATPVSAAEHASQTPVQARLQQKPSAQSPVAQSTPSTHIEPWGSRPPVADVVPIPDDVPDPPPVATDPGPVGTTVHADVAVTSSAIISDDFIARAYTISYWSLPTAAERRFATLLPQLQVDRPLRLGGDCSAAAASAQAPPEAADRPGLASPGFTPPRTHIVCPSRAFTLFHA